MQVVVVIVEDEVALAFGAGGEARGDVGGGQAGALGAHPGSHVGGLWHAVEEIVVQSGDEALLRRVGQASDLTQTAVQQGTIFESLELEPGASNCLPNRFGARALPYRGPTRRKRHGFFPFRRARNKERRRRRLQDVDPLQVSPSVKRFVLTSSVGRDGGGPKPGSRGFRHGIRGREVLCEEP